ncbi:hypothetical protein B0J17DRAFT_645631 [Rhizoctonia solani]|nr:hypothetical protein B0J17DRAFT_645631 [Rhizoctonia solani]
MAHLTNEDVSATNMTQSAVANIGVNHWSSPFINKLPAEVLGLIMQIVVSYASCCKKANSLSKESQGLRYPDVLTHVCSHWREVALRSRSLWSHIDILISGTPGIRAMTFLDRVGQSPVGLHLFEDRETQGGSPAPFEFLTPTKLRLKSLELFVRSGVLNGSCASTLSICLATCTTGYLAELVIRKVDPRLRPPRPKKPIFIKAHNHPTEITPSTPVIEPAYMVLDLPHERLEDVLRSTVVLRLDQIYPQWTSNAYCGLVELRLLGGLEVNATIPEFQLVNILRSSPSLRVLHFELGIVDVAPLGTAIDNLIVLCNLEMMNLKWMQDDGIEIFFRWFAPAPKLFQFSLLPSDEDMDFEHPATVAFLTGSNITTIHANQLYPKEIVGLVGHCRHIRVLALKATDIKDAGGAVPFQVNTLYLIDCEYDADSLSRFIQIYSVQKLVVYESGFRSGRLTKLFPDEAPVALTELCSDILILPGNGPDPVEGWEAFWH